ncbi:MAG: HypC/HybG/HupF family hydrogenase formation chaperone [Bryobacteraceae bacterium]
MCLAIPGKILEAAGDDERHLAVVDVMGVRRKVDLALLSDDRPVAGDWVLIHVGFAMSKISEEQALDTLRILESLGESDAALEEAHGYGLGEAPS